MTTARKPIAVDHARPSGVPNGSVTAAASAISEAAQTTMRYPPFTDAEFGRHLKRG